MTSVQIPFIEFTNNRIQKSSIIIDNNQFNVEFKDNKYIVTKGNVMSQSNSPAAPIVTESAEPIVTESATPTVAKNVKEKPEKIESTNIAAETNKKGATNLKTPRIYLLITPPKESPKAIPGFSTKSKRSNPKSEMFSPK